MSKLFGLGSRVGKQNLEDLELNDEEDEEDESDFGHTPISSCFVPEEDDVFDVETAAIELFEYDNNRKPTEEELKNFKTKFGGDLKIIKEYENHLRELKLEKELEGTTREFLFSFIYYMPLNEITLEILQKVKGMISNQALKHLHYFLLDTEGHNGVNKLIQLWSSLKKHPARNNEILIELIILFRACLRHDYGVQYIVNSRVREKSGARINFFDDLLTTWYYARNQNQLMIEIIELMTLITVVCDDCHRNIMNFEENKENLEKEQEKVFMTQSMMMTSVMKTPKKIQASKINFNQIDIPQPAYKKILNAFSRFRKRMYEVVTFQFFIDRMVANSVHHEYVTRSLMFINQILHSTRFHHDEKNQKRFLKNLLLVGKGSLQILIKSLQHMDPDQKLRTQIKEFQSLLVFDEEYEVDYEKMPMEKMRLLYVQMKGKDSWMILSNILERFHRLNESMESEFRKRLEVQSLHFEEEIDEQVDKMMNNNWKRIEDIFKKVRFKRDLQRGEQESMNFLNNAAKGGASGSSEFSEDEFKLVFGEDVEHSVEFKNLLLLLSTKDINEIQEDEIAPPDSSSSQRWVDPALVGKTETSGAVKLFRKLVGIVNEQAQKKDEEIIDLKKKLAEMMSGGKGGLGGGIGPADEKPLNIEEWDKILGTDGDGQDAGPPSDAPALPPMPPPLPVDPKVYSEFEITDYFRENQIQREREYKLRNLSVTRLKNIPEENSIFIRENIARNCLSKVFSDLGREEEGDQEEEENNVRTNPRFFLSNVVKTFCKKKQTQEEIRIAQDRAEAHRRRRESQVSFLNTKLTTNTELLLGHQKKLPSEVIKCVMRYETQRLNVDVIKQLITIFPREMKKRNELKSRMDEYFNRPPSPVRMEGGPDMGGQKGEGEEEEGEEEERVNNENQIETAERTREIRMKRLSDADKFLSKTLELDHYLERLQCWMFMESNYSQSIERVETNLWRMDVAFEMLLEGRGGFFDFLKYILVVANTLNAREYPVYSFHISNLTNLSMMKPFASEASEDDGAPRIKNSILFYLLEYIYINDPSSLEFVELYSSKFRFDMSVKEMNEELVKLRIELKRVETHQNREARVTKDKFGRKAPVFHADGNLKVKILQNRVDESIEKLKILGNLYAEEVGRVPSTEDDNMEQPEQEQVGGGGGESTAVAVKRPSLLNLKDGFFKELDEFLGICKKDIEMVKKFVDLERKRLMHQRTLRNRQLEVMNNNDENAGFDGIRDIDFIQRAIEQGRIINQQIDEDQEDEEDEGEEGRDEDD